MFKFVLIILSATLISACTGTSSGIVQPATPVGKTDNTIIIQQPFEAVWDRMVKNLATDFFVINNIDKSSRLLNVSFSTSNAQEYVDCGRFVGSWTAGKSRREDYDFPLVSSSRHIIANAVGMFEVRRNVRTEGRSNIYIAPEGANTNVTVNVKYIISVTKKIQQQAWSLHTGELIPHPDTFPHTEREIWDLTTNSPRVGQEPECYATGGLEKKILSYAN